MDLFLHSYGRRKMKRYIENLDSPMINHSTDMQIIVIKRKAEISQINALQSGKTLKARYTLAIKQICTIGYKKDYFHITTEKCRMSWQAYC